MQVFDDHRSSIIDELIFLAELTASHRMSSLHPDSMPARDVTKLIDFIKLQGHILEKVPGFSSTLGFSHQRIQALAPAITFQDSSLSVQLPVTESLLLPGRKEVSLGTYAALIDDVTTWAIFLDNPKAAKPGVSVSLRADRSGPSVKPGDEITITGRVDKTGRNMGFLSADIHNSRTGDLLCRSSHVKYLASLGFVTDQALTSYGWKIAEMYANQLPDVSGQGAKTMEDLFGPIQFLDDRRAVLDTLTPHYASPGGPIHGGAQAVLIEIAGAHAAEKVSSSLQLRSIHVEYLSSPRAPVEMVVDCHPQQDPSVLEVTVSLNGGGRCLSRGFLQFSKVGQSKL